MVEEKYTELDNELEDQEGQEEQAGTLEDYLAAHTVEGETENVVLCERLKGFEFTIGSMSKEEHAKYIDQCLVRAKNGKIVKQNTKLFEELVVLNHCIYPDFKSIAFISKVNALTPQEALSKTLKSGEISALSTAIMKFNGFDNDFETYRKKVKNS